MFRDYRIILRVLRVEVIRRDAARLPQRQRHDAEERCRLYKSLPLEAAESLLQQVQQQAHAQHKGRDEVIDIPRLIHR